MTSRPTDVEIRYDRGEAFGVILTYGDTKQRVSFGEALSRDLTKSQSRFVVRSFANPKLRGQF